MTLGISLPRFYPILDTATLERRNIGLADAAAAILDGGARALQLRHKGTFSRDLFDQAARIADECSKDGVLWVVNDRADMAHLLKAGVHLGQDDLLPRDARRVMPLGIIGYSTHNDQQLCDAAAEPADYLALGPIFGTISKANPDPVVGTVNLKRWRSLTDRPLVAIGGITRATAPDVIEAGADSVAVISDLYPEGADACGLRKRTEEWLQLLA
jgi:thiamine-phosphate pyrophosphorylase